jgi:NAD-dependent dihydropyrimidine dehydrogenase PreA subunit
VRVKIPYPFLDFENLDLRIKKMGADLVGFGDVSSGLASEFSHIPKAIALGIKYPVFEVDIRTPHYFLNRSFSIDNRLQEIQKKVAAVLRNNGWRALPIPPDSHRENSSFIARIYHLFPHKTAATCSGLGWIGKSGLLISQEFGPRLNWATVLTNAPLMLNSHPVTSSQCGNCHCCVDACPAGAIRNVLWERKNSYEPLIDVQRCFAQLQKNKELYGYFSCGVCVMVCPQGVSKQKSK